MRRKRFRHEKAGKTLRWLLRFFKSRNVAQFTLLVSSLISNSPLVVMVAYILFISMFHSCNQFYSCQQNKQILVCSLSLEQTF